MSGAGLACGEGRARRVAVAKGDQCRASDIDQREARAVGWAAEGGARSAGPPKALWGFARFS